MAVLLSTWQDRPVTISVKHNCITVSVERQATSRTCSAMIMQDAHRAGLHPLTYDERIAQQAAIERQLQFSGGGSTPHISRYDIREFVY